MADARNIQLGPCKLTAYHPSLGTVDLGHTIGGVTATYTPEFHETKVDKFGNSVVEQFLIGERFKLEGNLAENTLPNLRTILNQGNLAGDDSVSVGSVAGKKASANAFMVVAHPLAYADTVRDYDVTLFKAVSVGELKLEHKNDGEKVLPFVFDGLIDENRTDGSMIGFIGDSIA
jgi:hypothetical protein